MLFKSSFKYIIFVIGFILLLDISTKYLTNQYLPHMNHASAWYPYGGIPVFKNILGTEFSISHATNLGAAWGIFSQYQMSLLIFRIALIMGLLGYLLVTKKSRPQQFFLTCIVAGAIGNVLDYFIYGHVVDMLHFVILGYDFPVFNFADSSIFIGVAGYILTSSRAAKYA